jgi:hypothetical protein
MQKVFGDKMYLSIKAEVDTALDDKPAAFEGAMSFYGIERYLTFQYTPDAGVDGEVAGF